MKERRSIESWRIARVWPTPPKITSWWATRPGRRTEWIGWWTLPPAASISSWVRFAVPEGASSFLSWWSSTISHSGMCLAIVCETSISNTAPIAKLGATKQLAREASAAARAASRSKPVVPTTVWTPASRHCLTLARAVSGTVKSTTTSASGSTSESSVPSEGSARPLSSSPSASSTASQTAAPILPAAPATATLITQAPPDAKRRRCRLMSCGDQRLAYRRQCGLEAIFVGADAGGGQLVSGVQLGRQLGQVVDRDRIHFGEHLVEGFDRQPEQGRPRDSGHPRRRRLRGEDEASLDALLRPHQLLFGDRLGAQARHLGADDLAGLLDVVLAGADVGGNQALVGELLVVGADRVGEAALLAHLAEEAG